MLLVCLYKQQFADGILYRVQLLCIYILSSSYVGYTTHEESIINSKLECLDPEAVHEHNRITRQNLVSAIGHHALLLHSLIIDKTDVLCLVSYEVKLYHHSKSISQMLD